MDTIADLIDAAQARTGASSIDIAGRLDRSKQLVSNWKSGAKVPTDGDVMALARMAGQDADRWLAVAQAARTEGEAKARWQHIAQRLAGTAATLLVAIAFAFPGGAHAVSRGLQASTDAALCEMVYRVWRYYVGLLRLLLERLLQRQLVLPPAKDATA